MSAYRHRRSRSGNILVLSALMLVVMFAMLAFAVDLGYLQVVRAQLQRSADAAAIAATWDLIDDGALSGNPSPASRIELARTTASQYAGLNLVTNVSPTLSSQDVQIGYLANPSDPDAPMSFDDPSRFNAVRVLVRRTAGQNGEVPLFFARAIGSDSSSSQAEATAAFLRNFVGFSTPSPTVNLGFVPLALDRETWYALLAGTGTDDWCCDPDSGEVAPGSDGILEGNLFPQGTGCPGNRGTVDIGSNNNSTADIARQILDGISEQDLEHHGGKLALDENGELLLNGDTGISAGVKDELESIKGQPRIVPLFSTVSGNGNNAWYTIVGFAGVRIVEVKLTGQMSRKRVMIQPAQVKALGGIPATTDTQKSHFIYSPVWLVR